MFVTITDHADDYYNGVYWQTEDWGGFPHFTKEDGTAHLYHFDSGYGYWQLDYRTQDGSNDWYDGGYASGDWDYTESLNGGIRWSA